MDQYKAYSLGNHSPANIFWLGNWAFMLRFVLFAPLLAWATTYLGLPIWLALTGFFAAIGLQFYVCALRYKAALSHICMVKISDRRLMLTNYQQQTVVWDLIKVTYLELQDAGIMIHPSHSNQFLISKYFPEFGVLSEHLLDLASL